ncbi:hypothetical protein [Streptomyces otsuchiensis]|uniref:hypothetical protein n=1 Tax=Streptomyces otsuchiensis TaxID=2681388 RepID=UPI00102FD267|nr:hypothetical protein [Streptomyces otsuchiensis]
MSDDLSQELREPDDRGAPDVTLDVPVLNVEDIEIEAEDLRASVTLQAELLDLLKINVGADVSLGRLNLGIKGVEVQALLEVHLDNVAAMIEQALTTIAENPQIVQDIAHAAESATESVSGAAAEAVPEAGKAAVESAGAASKAIESAGDAVGDTVGDTAEEAVQDTTEQAADAVEPAAESAGTSAESAGDVAGKAPRPERTSRSSGSNGVRRSGGGRSGGRRREPAAAGGGTGRRRPP